MIRFLFIFTILLMTAACSTTPDSSATAEADGSYMTAGEAEMVGAQDVIFDDISDADGMGSEASADGLTTPPVGDGTGSQDDLVSSVGDRVFYGYDSSELSEEARRTLDQQAEWLRTYPSVKVVIEGHADERGTREYNLALGERRANAARNYLVALGIDANRLSVISYGKERPAVLGSNPASWARNRRAVLVVQ